MKWSKVVRQAIISTVSLCVFGRLLLVLPKSSALSYRIIYANNEQQSDAEVREDSQRTWHSQQFMVAIDNAKRWEEIECSTVLCNRVKLKSRLCEVKYVALLTWKYTCANGWALLAHFCEFTFLARFLWHLARWVCSLWCRCLPCRITDTNWKKKLGEEWPKTRLASVSTIFTMFGFLSPMLADAQCRSPLLHLCRCRC